MKKGMPINHTLLKWARETMGYSLEEEIKSYPKFKEWEEGNSYPTYLQLKKLSQRYNRPIAVFFFSEIPKEISIEKSLRALSEETFHTLAPSTRYLFRKAKAFQLYLNQLFTEDYTTQIQKINWLRKNYKKNSINLLAKKIREILGVSLTEQKSWKTVEEAVDNWRNVLAEKGIYVFKEAFKDDRVSGFCIYDEIFPIIFINNSQPKTRQIFTIFHELAHLIFKENYLDVIDNYSLEIENQESENIEAKCNAFASGFLLPDEDFTNYLPINITDDREIEKLASIYKVSKEVIIRKLLTLKYIKREFYNKKNQRMEDCF